MDMKQDMVQEKKRMARQLFVLISRMLIAHAPGVPDIGTYELRMCCWVYTSSHAILHPSVSATMAKPTEILPCPRRPSRANQQWP